MSERVRVGASVEVSAHKDEAGYQGVVVKYGVFSGTARVAVLSQGVPRICKAHLLQVQPVSRPLSADELGISVTELIGWLKPLLSVCSNLKLLLIYCEFTIIII